MKKYIFDGSDLCTNNISGVSRYAYEVITNIDSLLDDFKGAIEIRLCYPEGHPIILPLLRNILVVSLPLSNRPFRTTSLRRYAKKNKSIVCTFGPSIAYSKNMNITIHDVRAIERREYDSLRARLYMFMILISCKILKSTIITDTEYQKMQISKYSHISLNHIRVFGCGWEHVNRFEVNENIFCKHKDIKKGEYYYTIGSIAKHKNYKWVFEVAKRNTDVQFVVAGNISKATWGIDNSGYLYNNIIFTGYVTDDENKSLINECKALIQPSKYEGFGLPPLEALALGKKTFVSNVSCLPEIYSGYAVLFDPDNYDVDLEYMMNQKLLPPEQIALRYSWRKVAKLWLELILN